MLRNRIIAAALCAGLALSLGGCMEKAEDKVSETVSRMESELEGAGSRIESNTRSSVRCGLHGGSGLLPPGRPGEPLPQPGASLNKRPLPAWQRPFVFQGHCALGPFLVYWDKHLSRRRDTR